MQAAVGEVQSSYIESGGILTVSITHPKLMRDYAFTNAELFPYGVLEARSTASLSLSSRRGAAMFGVARSDQVFGADGALLSVASSAVNAPLISSSIRSKKASSSEVICRLLSRGTLSGSRMQICPIAPKRNSRRTL